MARLKLTLTLGTCCSLLWGCDRLDPLAAIDSPDGQAVILDTISGENGDRVICVRTSVAESCSRSTAEAVVRGAGEDVEVTAEWEDNRRVTIHVTSGVIEKAAPTALAGKVHIEYR